ncbi:putative pentatricopeptide repeat-containing protein At3g11460, mitochondrial [Dioscorea cayenensis subsp. rotundata]|uniref:Pentatricopeptide repeat-containing protein At3g11460, mitochondrial n=1 Tax=Dioscorea cayennensis subsp. rotundata TaxID=55577 RepID=A0AB40CAN6_DIOCR|nr:putative pentatricopeptide repeat-containing protein At3g11460, mitochondrial [Dioscorea cayenensis subsp. rotundata]
MGIRILISRPNQLGSCLSKQSMKFHTATQSHSSLKQKIKHFASAGEFEHVFDLCRAVHLSESKLDSFTLPCVLKACTTLLAFEEGLSIHAFIIKSGHECNLYPMNSLIEMYTKLGFLPDARKVFDEMPHRNLVSWNLMISGYGACGYPELALEFCGLMRSQFIALDEVGIKIILRICGSVQALRAGESIHARVFVFGLSNETALLTAVLDMYGKCRKLDAAEQVFDEILCRDVVCWNAMITGYSKGNKPEKMLELFKNMLVENFKPSIPTMLLSIQACTQLSLLHFGKAVHSYAIKNGFFPDVSIGGLLIDLYSKCGELGSACSVFYGMSKRRLSLNSWSCLMNGLGMHGHGKAVLMVFFQMLKNGIDPDGICFLLILSSCSHNTGFSDIGRRVFRYMVEQFGIRPTMEHYASMVDIIGRSGCLEEALKFICKMPVEPNSDVYGAFLGACRIHGHLEMERVFTDFFVDSDCTIPGFYKLVLSVHACRNNWDEVSKIRRLIEEKRFKSSCGCSLIESS